MWAPIADEHLAQVDDLGLAGDVVDDRRALRHHGRHHAGSRSPRPRGSRARGWRRAGRRAPRRRPARARCVRRHRAPAARGCACPGPREPIASPPGRATLGAATAGDERTQHGDRCPEASYELVGGLVLELLRHLDGRAPGRRLAGRVGVAGVGDLDGAAELAQQLAHHGDVEDVRHVVDHRPAGREQRGRPSASARSSWPRRRGPSPTAVASADPRRPHGSCPRRSL